MSPSGLKGETAVIPPTRLEVSGRIGHFHIEVARPRLSTVSSKKKKDETLCRTDCRGLKTRGRCTCYVHPSRLAETRAPRSRIADLIPIRLAEKKVFQLQCGLLASLGR